MIVKFNNKFRGVHALFASLSHVTFTVILVFSAGSLYAQRFEKFLDLNVTSIKRTELNAVAPRANGNTLVSIQEISTVGQGSGGIAEINPQGDTVWYSQFHRDASYGHNYISFIKELPDKRIFMAGGTHYSSGFFHSAFWLADSAGNITAYRQLVGASNLTVTIHDADVAPDGSIYYAASHYDIYSGGVVFYNWTVPIYGKLNSSLGLVWTRTFGSTSHTNNDNNEGNVYGIKVGSDGNIIIMGREGSPNGSGGGRIQIAKVSPSGSLIWRKSRALANQTVPVGMDLASNGDIYVATNLGTGNAIYGNRDFVVEKLDYDGNLVWARSYGSTTRDELNKVCFDTTGNMLLLAGGHTTSGSEAGAMFVKIDTAGALLVSKTYGAPGVSDVFSDITRIGSRYQMVGTTTTIGGYLVQTDLLGATTCNIADISMQSAPFSSTFSTGLTHNNYTPTISAQNWVYDAYSTAETVSCYACSDEIREISVAACGSYYAGGALQTVSGTYYDTLGSFYGCDSVVITHLTIQNPPTVADAGNNQARCANTATMAANMPSVGTGIWSVVQGNAVFANVSDPQTNVTGLSAGVNILRWTISNGTCTPSVSDVTITVNALPTITAQASPPVLCNGNATTLTANGAVQYNWSPGNISGNNIQVSPNTHTTYTVTGTDANGCSSTATVQVSVNPVSASTITHSACNSYTLNGQTYTASGTYTQNLTNVHGCDSILTLHLTIRNSTSSTITHTACDSYTLNGQTYTSGGTYIQHLNNVLGCDSTITLHLTIRQSTASSITHSACGGYTLNGQTYTSSGTYTQHFTNAQGCDSTLTLYLTILQATTSTLTQTACNNYTLNGQTYISSGTYTQMLTNSQGCDSILTLHLTIRNSTSSTITHSACNSYTLNGQTYTGSGTYTQQLTNSQGCDSIITLHLTIHSATSSTLTHTSCGNYTLNGQTYTSSGTYTQMLMNSKGCDSIITLHLTISQATSSTLTHTSCDSYTLNGQTYTGSGTYTQQLTNSQGCDSIITLHLTIHNATTSAITQTSCGSYTLNGQTYTGSGTYTQQLTNSQGCDSIITLHLTIGAIDNSVTQNNHVLTANESGADYQWMNCSTQQLITGETGQSYTAAANGDYAVIISKNSCIDTSACYTVVTLSAGQAQPEQAVSVFPNPTTGPVTIAYSDDLAGALVDVYALTGEVLIQQQIMSGSQHTIDLSVFPAGMYLVQVSHQGRVSRTRIILY